MTTRIVRSQVTLWIAMVVGLIGFASNANAADYSIAWATGTSQAPILATVGDTITFNWSGNHNVEAFPNFTDFSGCDFNSASLVSALSPTVITLNTPGDFYYGCSVGAHCSSGSMFIEVSVSAAVPVPSVEPLFVVFALGLAATATIAADRGWRSKNVRCS